ncbi:MAG: Nramp family divalent metal transporter [Pirellulales bacterium]|nr:Nramp family divalent metal transporter [Pirellulales bacterium]
MIKKPPTDLMDYRTEAGLRNPPTGIWSTICHLGPGLIISGSIVGSGELILTTHLGAEIGFVFLWLILLGCMIKVFVQIELGRYTISSGETALEAFNRVPGPRWRASWIVWWWLVMVVASFLQVGGIVGGVGQVLQIVWPISSIHLIRWTIPFGVIGWTIVVTLSGMFLLYRGRYRFIETVTTLLVFLFTSITLLSTVLLQWTEYAVSPEQLLSGLEFAIPSSGLATAFATFGIIGVGASELIYYPYWCLEKGYARFVGPVSPTEEWADRARKWIRVLKVDAWLSMVIYTTSTIAFYILGAAVLHARGALPEKDRMIVVLADMYVQTIGPWGMVIFLIGALAVLYSTFFVATASNARVIADCLQVVGAVRFRGTQHRQHWVGWLCLLLPTIYCVSYMVSAQPVQLVRMGAFMQAMTLPFIAAATIWLRYRHTDPRLRPGIISDLFLWIATLAMFVVSLYKVGTMVIGIP